MTLQIKSEPKLLPTKQFIDSDDWKIVETCLGEEYKFTRFWRESYNKTLHEGALLYQETQKIIDAMENYHQENTVNEEIFNHVITFFRETVEAQNFLSMKAFF